MHSGNLKIVSFSGIDGAGKSTQIDALLTWLRSTGYRVRLLTFWDDVVMFSRFREGFSQAVFKGDKGVGSPEKPVSRRDKNVRSWPVTAARFLMYFLDGLSLWKTVRGSKARDCDVLIFDRYIFDELANLPLERWVTRRFVQILRRFVPKPELACFLDADPAAARQRKPEYPLEFIVRNRAAYLALARLLPGVTVIPPQSVEETQFGIRRSFLENVQGTAKTSRVPRAECPSGSVSRLST